MFNVKILNTPIVLFFLAALIWPQVANSQDLAELIAEAEKSLVRIEVESNAGGSLGSGYVVDSTGILVSNVHVMAGARKATVVFPNKKTFQVTGTYLIDPKRDICVFQISETKDLPVMPMAEKLPRKGEEVIAMGSPSGLSFTATRGIVSAIRGAEELGPGKEGTWVQVDASLSPGNSGGPIMNRKGELVAMSTLASFGQTQNLNFGISVMDIAAAVKKVKKKKKLTKLDKGVAKVDMEERSASSDPERPEISSVAITDYVKFAKENFKDMTKNVSKKYTEANKHYRIMKRGMIANRGAEVVRETNQRGDYRLFFASSSIKDLHVGRQKKLVDELRELKEKMNGGPTNETMSMLLMQAGPPVDTTQKGSVGLVAGATILRVIDENTVLIDLAGGKFVVWIKDVTGLAQGHTLSSRPVYVIGSTQIPGAGINLTMLNGVLETELNDAINSFDDTRTWSDKSGKFSIEAKFVKIDGKNVVLEKADDKTISVPISRLSQADVDYLKDKVD